MEEYPFEMQEILEDDTVTSTEFIESRVNWYKRGAITLDELLYKIAQSENKLSFEELAELFLDILEQNTKRERKDIRHKLLEIIIRRSGK